MNGECTIGTKRLDERVFMFKNRDLVYPDFKQSGVFDDAIFAVTGVDLSTEDASGVSFGVNRWGLGVCSTNVLTSNDTPYDLLLEHILREARTFDEAVNVVQDKLDAGLRYQWCNMVLASSSQVGAIEVGDGEIAVERDPVQMVRTNHHLLLDTIDVVDNSRPDRRVYGGMVTTSRKRRQKASEILTFANTLTDLMTLVGTHSESKGVDSICRHWPGRPHDTPRHGATVGSYILELMFDGGSPQDMRFHYTTGNPCCTPFREIVIDFDTPMEDKQRLVL